MTKQSAEQERAAIVAWLRNMRKKHLPIVQKYPTASIARHEELLKLRHVKFLADQIERREHLKKGE